MRTYKSAFIIPASSEKKLDEAGWIFETDDRLKPEVLDALCQVLGLTEAETFLGMTSYVGDGAKATVSYDQAGLIESISIQLWKMEAAELEKVFHGESFAGVELFVPEVME